MSVGAQRRMAATDSPDPGAPALQPSPRAVHVWLSFLGVATLAAYSATIPLLQTHQERAGVILMALYLCVFPLYFAAVSVVWRYRARLPQTSHGVILIAAGALLFRLAVLASPMPPNPDYWRYLWEGKVLLAGLNTYAAPPRSPVYDRLRADLETRGDSLYQLLGPDYRPVVARERPAARGALTQTHYMSLTEVRSTYGSVASALFAVPSLQPLNRELVWRALMTAFDLATGLLLLVMLSSVGYSPLWALVYWWSPLCMKSFAERGQIEAPLAFLTVLAVWLVMSRRPVGAGIAFGLALGIKVSPILLVPLLWRYGGRHFAVAAGVAAVIVLMPILVVGPDGWQGFMAMGRYWRGNDSLFSVLALAFSQFTDGVTADRVSRLVVAAGAVSYAVWRAAHARPGSSEQLLRDVVSVLAASILLSPLAYPWYAVSLLALLCFVPSPGLLLLTASLMMWYLNYIVGLDPAVPRWITELAPRGREPWRWIGYVPVYLLLISSYVRGRRQRTETLSPPDQLARTAASCD